MVSGHVERIRADRARTTGHSIKITHSGPRFTITVIMINDIIFDFDGTLVDSLPGLEQAIRASWEEIFPARVLPPLRPLLGPPIRKIFLSIDAALTLEQLEQLAARFRHLYDSHYCLESDLFPKCEEVLRILSGQSRRLYIATNKPQKPTSKIIEHFQIDRYFTSIRSLDSQTPPYESKAHIVQDIISSHGLDPLSTVMVGDAVEDATSAAKCGIGFVSACYGYGQISTKQFEHGLFDLNEISDLPRLLEETA